jgi:hypothetical protein
MTELYETLNLLTPYIKLYLTIGICYVIFYSFMKGIIKQEWETKDILHGLFFPLSIANELGFFFSYLPMLLNWNKAKGAQTEEIKKTLSDIQKSDYTPEKMFNNINDRG